jgi:PadR family transcriptional regulator
LERERLVASALATVNGRQRRVYRLTRRGERALDERRTEWRSFSTTVTAMLRTRPA